MTNCFQFAAIRRLVAAAVVMGGLTLTGSTASATDYYQPRCYWKTVTVYQTVQEPCVHYVTRYTDCGRPYQVRVITYKTVRVPVQKQVKVCG